jgi:hypothetical protein
MKAPPIIIGVIAILFLVTTSAATQTPKADAATFQLGNQVVTIPSPEGFEEAASLFEGIKDHYAH